MLARLIRGIGANVFAQMVVLAVQLVLVPVMATRWGLERYGTWILLFSVPSYLSLGDFGFATAAASEMTMKVARGDREGASVTFQSAWTFILGVSAMIILLVLAAGLWVPDTLLPSTSQVDAQQVRWTAVTLVVYALVCLQGSIVQAGYQCSGQYALGISLSAVVSLIEGGAAVSIVVLGGSLSSVALSYVTCRVVCLLVQAGLLTRVVPWLRFGVGQSSLDEIRQLWRPAAAVMAIPLAQATFLQGTVIAIGVAASASAVPVFTAVRTLTRTGIQFATILNHAVMPEMAMATALRDERLQARLVTMTLVGSTLVVVPLALGILVLGEWFVGLWTRGAIRPSFLLIAVMTAVMVVQGFWVPLSNLLLAVNRQRSYAFAFLAASVLCTALAYPLTVWIGSVGAAVALLGLDIFMAFHVVRVISSQLIAWKTLAALAPGVTDVTTSLTDALSTRRHFFRVERR